MRSSAGLPDGRTELLQGSFRTRQIAWTWTGPEGAGPEGWEEVLEEGGLASSDWGGRRVFCRPCLMCGRIIQSSSPDLLALKIVHGLEDRDNRLRGDNSPPRFNGAPASSIG